MYTVFASRCRKSQRERTAHSALSHDPNAWSNPTQAGADNRTVLDGFMSKLHALPRAYAEVLWLVDYHDYPYADAAQTLGVPLGTVMSRLHRARRTMRAALDPQASVG
jgi:RNA polymerase sigma-70 factor, ECF subfamily